MGCDCNNYLPAGTRPDSVAKFLSLLGYQRLPSGRLLRDGAHSRYFYFKDEDYKFYTGIYAELYDDSTAKCAVLWTRTNIWRSKFDSDFHNYTIREVRTRFGGYFVSDYGRNRYLRYDGPVRLKAEAGLYRCFGDFSDNIKRAHLFIESAHSKEDRDRICKIQSVDRNDPRIISANILIPFLVSSVEDFFRSSYIVLLQYSGQRDRIVQNARLQGVELAAIDCGKLTVIEAVAKSMSFQDMNKVTDAFRRIDAKIDLYALLKRPYGRRRESFWDVLTRIISHRHDLVHRARIDPVYYPANIVIDIRLVQKAIWRTYQRIIELYDWSPVEDWEF